MKQFGKIMLAGMMTVLLAACGHEAPKQPEAKPESAAAQAAPAQQAAEPAAAPAAPAAEPAAAPAEGAETH